MPTAIKIRNTLLGAQLQMANLVNANLAQLQVGNGLVKWAQIRQFNRNIIALDNLYLMGDYVSPTAILLYDCLNSLIGFNSATGTLDPNFQFPGGQTIISVPVLSGYNELPIQFSTSSGSPAFVLSNYAVLYKPLFGNNPTTLDVYTTASGEQKDEQTAPIIMRVNPSDVTSDIISITWPYPIATQGYVLIGGIGTGGQGGGGGGTGSGATVLNFTETNLLQDGGGSWYLPLTLPAGKIPFVTLSNGISVTTLFDKTFSPFRLYGFANNDAQSILVKII